MLGTNRVIRWLKQFRQQPHRFTKLNRADKTDLELTYPESPSQLHHELALNIKPSMGYTTGDIQNWKSDGKEKLWDLVGKIELPENTGCEEQWLAEDDLGYYEKHVIEGELGGRIPIYKCIPKLGEPPYRWIVCLQGHNTGMHNSIGVDAEKEMLSIGTYGERNIAVWCMKNGYAALCIEQRAFGERKETVMHRRSPHPCQDAAMHALILGRTLMGERILDVRIGLRYLTQSDNYGIRGIGIMGTSLGGTVSVYCAALLSEEIDFVIAGSCVSSIDASILKIYHCADLYIPKLRKYFEFGDILGLIAPNPLLIVQGREDPIFPIDGLNEALRKARSIYSVWNAENMLKVRLGEGGHQFFGELATDGLVEMDNDDLLN